MGATGLFAACFTSDRLGAVLRQLVDANDEDGQVEMRESSVLRVALLVPLFGAAGYWYALGFDLESVPVADPNSRSSDLDFIRNGVRIPLPKQPERVIARANGTPMTKRWSIRSPRTGCAPHPSSLQRWWRG